MSVADVPASLAFYRLLGLDLPAEADSQPHVEATLQGGVRLMWDTPEVLRSIDPDWTPPSGAQRMTLAFLCGSPQEVDETHALITAAGYATRMKPWDAEWGQRYAVVVDPDGNNVDLFASIPAS